MALIRGKAHSFAPRRSIDNNFDLTIKGLWPLSQKRQLQHQNDEIEIYEGVYVLLLVIMKGVVCNLNFTQKLWMQLLSYGAKNNLRS